MLLFLYELTTTGTLYASTLHACENLLFTCGTLYIYKDALLAEPTYMYTLDHIGCKTTDIHFMITYNICIVLCIHIYYTIGAPQTTEAYASVRTPVSISAKLEATTHVKIDTCTGSNVLPLCIFSKIHPNCICPTG